MHRGKLADRVARLEESELIIGDRLNKNEAEILRKKSLDLSCDLNRLSEALVRERQEKKEEVAAMMQRVKQLESAEDELLEMATKFGLTEVEDEIYRDDERNDEVSKGRRQKNPDILRSG